MLCCPCFLKHASIYYDDCDLTSATYFELRPVSDGQYTCSTYLYGDDTNLIQIRMGQHNRPCELIAKYNFEDAADACRDFFELSRLSVSLWYNGNDLLTQVVDRVDMATQIADDRFSGDDPELQELFENSGLDEDEQSVVRTNLSL